MVIKQTLKIVAVFTTLCMVAIGGLVGTAEAIAGGNTPVTYEVQESPAFSLTVTAEGNGSVRYQDQAITGQTMTFQMKADDEMVFELSPDAGERIEQALLDGVDVLDQLKDGKLTVHGANKEQQLYVRFSGTKQPDGTKPEATKPDEAKPEHSAPNSGGAPTTAGTTNKPNSGSNPKTGDSTSLSSYLLVGTLSLTGLLFLMIRKNESRKRDERGMI